MRKLFPTISKDFGVRLKALMYFNNITTSMELAVKLCGYEQKPKTGTSEYEICRTKERTIKNHLKLGNLTNLNSSESLTTIYIAEYCHYFHCSADYLLGYIDYPTHSYTDIGEETGLSVSAINSIKQINNSWDPIESEVFDFILKDSNVFSDFLKWISIYIDNTYTTPITRNPQTGSFEQCGYSVDGKNAISFGQEIIDNKGNPGYKQIGIGVDILESHAMLKIQEILMNWKNEKKKDGD
ncbi:hypothetical protein [Clostridium sp. Marseille-P3244]|uniref:hypothetical protein n=1 Tax=Clostridium sp. Marseille-P3244 TaxID=1871020 RepID=UPI0009312182|nr:hypothetical protein [Clostridium sp. Marseille-P3244]